MGGFENITVGVDCTEYRIVTNSGLPTETIPSFSLKNAGFLLKNVGHPQKCGLTAEMRLPKVMRVLAEIRATRRDEGTRSHASKNPKPGQ